MSVIAIQFIRGCAKKGLIDFNEHALIRMFERQIEEHQVIESLINGKVIETQDHGQDIKILFQEATDSCPEFYTVVAAAHPFPQVLTVCRFKEEAWKYRNGLMIRRKEYNG